MTFDHPEKLLASVEAQINSVPPEEFFNNPEFEKQREAWCAALFGAGLRKLSVDSTVRVNDTNHRLDVDFEVKVKDETLEFQLVMAKDPDYRIGGMYKEFAAGKRTSFTYQPAAGAQLGPSWIHSAILKKVRKNYSGAKDLNLLVYVNFDAHQIHFSDIHRECVDLLASFASIWLISGTQICSLSAGSILPEVYGWFQIRDVSEYYA